MTKTGMPLSELLEEHDEGDVLRTVAEAVLQLLMETDVEGVIHCPAGHCCAMSREGAPAVTSAPRAASPTATIARQAICKANLPRGGYRDRPLDTRLGTLNLRVPKLRQGYYFPGFLEPRRTSEKALVALAIVLGPMADKARYRRPGSAASPRGVSMNWCRPCTARQGIAQRCPGRGLSGISKSTVSKLCKDTDDRVGEFLNRPLFGDWPYLWLDATYLKVRQGGRIVSIAAIIAVAVNTPSRDIAPRCPVGQWTDGARVSH